MPNAYQVTAALIINLAQLIKYPMTGIDNLKTEKFIEVKRRFIDIMFVFYPGGVGR